MTAAINHLLKITTLGQSIGMDHLTRDLIKSNPNDSDVMYVDKLVRADTVNPLPPSTIEAEKTKQLAPV